jgi:hypothetical protein
MSWLKNLVLDAGAFDVAIALTMFATPVSPPTGLHSQRPLIDL